MTAGTGTETLANVDPALLKWFCEAAVKTIEKAGHLEAWKKSPIWQGIYVAGADGSAYAQLDDWERDGFLKGLDAALAEFKKNPPAKVEITDAEIRKAAPRGPEASTSVIRVISRCTPLPKGAHPMNRSIGRDHLWIYPAEVGEIARTDTLPRRVALRIARFHLVDNVRGLADAWPPESVGKLEPRLTFVREAEGKRTYALALEFAAEKEYPGDFNYRGKLGVEGRLEAEFDVAKDRITRFAGLFEGQAWGANTNTWHQPRGGKFPLAIAMTGAEDATARVLGPVWRDYGLDYDDPK